ncbi:hypothetical protein BN874_2790010 [Candidatus Contendobacter odensis Run_B_J11]|uniref:Uncharacterized protein n=1 Tax=Candidatus Contendobacter odensis Run_B_J11 TaxID=1400861 RepID=A0A7U7J4Y2_9GAMM|nr:hypothetical protein BN874_2790010 [Candidatus Contendobacter odensis Run_B_J11]
MEDRRRTEPGYIAGFAQLDGAQQNQAVSATPVGRQSHPVSPHPSLNLPSGDYLSGSDFNSPPIVQIAQKTSHSTEVIGPLSVSLSGPPVTTHHPFIRFTSCNQTSSER